jgi:hypothetical protein
LTVWDLLCQVETRVGAIVLAFLIGYTARRF